MLTELENKTYKFRFGECDIELRYTLGALLELEKQGLKYTDIFSENLTADKILTFFYAGLAQKIDAERIVGIAETVGFEKLWGYCVEAMILSFPEPERNVVQKPSNPNGEEFSFIRLRTLICDIMGKSEDFFWSSTLGELISRWKEYAIAMGYADEPEKILEYDDEGM